MDSIPGMKRRKINTDGPHVTCTRSEVAQSCLTLCNYGLYSPWHSPGQNTGVSSFSLPQGIFPTLPVHTLYIKVVFNFFLHTFFCKIFWVCTTWIHTNNRLAQSTCKPVNPTENQPWIFIGSTDAEAEAPILQPPDAKNWLIRKDPEAWKDWGQEEKGGNRGYGWKASPTQWTWVWANSGKWWRTGKPGMLQAMGLQRVRHNLVTE